MSNRFTIRSVIEKYGNTENVDEILSNIESILKDRPSAIKEISPNFSLVVNSVNKSEFNKKQTAKAVETRAQQVLDRYEKVKPFVVDLMKRCPGVTLEEIGEELTAAGYHPQRAQKWNRSSVRFMLKKMDIGV